MPQINSTPTSKTFKTKSLPNWEKWMVWSNFVKTFGNDNYIVNLGHGILPNIPVGHAKAFVEAVKEYGIK